MKKLKRIIYIALACLLMITCFGSVACGSNDTTKENELRITYLNGGFGDEWLKRVADDFVAAKAADGVSISCKLEPKGTGLSGEIKTYLTAERNLSDVYLTQFLSDWQMYVITGGKLADLTSVYESEVEKLDGTKIKIKDFLLPEAATQAYIKPLRNSAVPAMPFYLPWSLLETSIIYNEDLLKATPKSGTSGNWTDAPKTMVELAAFCDDINAESAKTNNAYGGTVAPFSWGYGGINYFQSIFDVLWAQQQGVDKPRIEGEGTYYDFWNFESSDVWKQTGIQTAIDEWANIITDKSTGTWKNSIPNVSTTSFQESALAFCNKKSAMVLNGTFFELEQQKLLDKDGDGKNDFTIKMMRIPYSSNNLKMEDGRDANINLCNLSDMIIVPELAVNKELAKEFVAFMCNERYLLDFSKTTGCVRPFNYDPVELTAGDSSVVWSDFFMSCYNMRKHSDYNIFEYPVTASQNGSVSDYYIYKQPSLFITGFPALYDMRSKTGKQLMVGDNGEGGIYASAKTKWNSWKNDLGL